MVSWTFRKAEKFFDIQTWTGNSASDRAISHNLGSVPGMIIVKRTVGGGEDWAVWHREIHNNSSTVIYLNQTGAAVTSNSVFSQTNPTSTNFYVGDHPLSNNNGDSYVAYLFAHNNNDGGFGPKADQDIIKCGSVTSSGNGTHVALGFEPQWILIKKSSGAAPWYLFDNMRGMTADGADNTKFLAPNNNNEELGLNGELSPTATGFTLNTSESDIIGGTFIYMAIRRGSLFKPTDATKVFAVQDGRGASKLYTAGFPVDAFLQGNKNGDNWQLHSRLTHGKVLATDNTSAETDDTFYYFDDQTGIVTSSGGGSALTQLVAYMWKRSPSYFDVVAYTGTGSAKTVNHSLGVVPEMMWVKRRSGTRSWFVYHSALGNTGRIKLDTTDAALTGYGDWNSTTPTSSVFLLAMVQIQMEMAQPT